MDNDRLRIPVEDGYLTALGIAAYAFARLEWQVVWCHEKLQPGYVRHIGRRMAGQIADDYLQTVGKLSDAELREQLLPSAQEFKRLVLDRNAIVHGKPGTAPDGAQVLFRRGESLTVERLNQTADSFAACAAALNALFYGVLKGP